MIMFILIGILIILFSSSFIFLDYLIARKEIKGMSKVKLIAIDLDGTLLNDKKYKDCKECHIEPDWLLVYQIKDSELILLLFATGSHSELFN